MNSMIEQVFYFLRKRSSAFAVEKIQKSCRVLPIDLEEMLCWAESLRLPADGRVATINLVFHPLPSGHFALGRLRQVRRAEEAGTGHKAARGLYCLQYFIVDSEQLHLFGNNPILLFRRTLSLEPTVLNYPCGDPAAVTLASDTCFFDSRQMRALAVTPGADSLAYVTDQVLHRPLASFVCSSASPHIVSGVLNLLPVDYRPEVSFALELDFSTDRCLRLAGFSKKHPLPKRWAGSLIDLDSPLDMSRLGGWASYARRALADNGYRFFEKHLIERHRAIRRRTLQGECWFPPSAGELDAEGQKNLQALSASLAKGVEVDAPTGPDLADERVFKIRVSGSQSPHLTIPEKLRRWLLEARPDEEIFSELIDENGEEKDTATEIPNPEELKKATGEKSEKIGLETLLRLAGELSRRDKAGDPPKQPSKNVRDEPLFVYEGQNRLFSPYQRLLAIAPGREKALMDLDARIAEALGGDRGSLLELAAFWRLFSQLTDGDLFRAAQEEYIHYIRSVLVTGSEQVTGDARASMAALELIDILLDKNFT